MEVPKQKPAPKEKRRNNEKRKEKSRFAARCRRSRETEIFTDLGSALPLPQDQVAQLDKASVMRLAISYLRVRDMIKLVPTIQKKKGKKIKTDESVFLKSLEGFVLVLSAEGDFVYVSENIAEYLGITQIDLMGQSVYEYSHPCDHDEIKDILSAKAQEKTDKPKSFFLRLKCTLTNKGRSVNLKSASYKVIHCTGHILHVNSDQKKPDGVLNKCFIAIGQPIPHPSNIEAPLPTQTFLTKHSLDMKFTYADDKMFEFLGYNSDDLIGKSLYEYHHAMDSDSVSSAYKCLFSKGQCETTRYRFLGKTGGFAWVLTQATLIQDKVNKPHSVVCVNYVISGVECQDEIYTSFQLTPSQTTTTATSASPAVVVVEELLLDESCSLLTPPPTSPSSLSTSSSSSLGSCEPSVDSSLVIPEEVCVSPPIVAVVAAPAVRRPVTSTAKLFGGELPPVQQQQSLAPARQPQTATSKCFAPRTEEMSKGFLMFSDEEPGLTLLKDEPDDLTHLAPVAGDVCVPLDDNPCFASDMFMDTLLLRDFTLLTDEPCDPFMNSCDASPQLLSPNLSKTSDCSLHSLNSPSDSLTSPDDDHMFLNTPHTLDDDTDDADLLLKAPYIPMDADLPLFMSGDDLMWSSGNCANSNTTNCCNSSSSSSASSGEKHSLQSALRGENAAQQLLSNSSLAELLRSGVSKGSTRDVDAGGGGGGGGVEMLGRGMTGEEYYESNGRPNSSCWQTATNKTTNRLSSTATVAPSIPTKRTGRYSTTPANKRPKNESCDDSNLNNPNNKLPVELLHQLITMNSSRGGAGKRLSTGGGNNSRGKQQQQQQHWLLDTGGRHNSGNNSKAACCVSQPSDSVLMNLLDQELLTCPRKKEPPLPKLTSLTDSPTPPVPPLDQLNCAQAARRAHTIRTNSFSLLDPELTMIPSLLDLTEQDYEVNAPVNNLLLQGEELLNALEINTQNI